MIVVNCYQGQFYYIFFTHTKHVTYNSYQFTNLTRTKHVASHCVRRVFAGSSNEKISYFSFRQMRTPIVLII